MLVLHFDINDTITAFDKTDEISLEHKCNIIVSRSVYGKVVDDMWIININPYDETSSITFYDYAKEKYPNYKEITGIFTSTYGKQFNYLIDKMLKSMSDNFLFESFTRVVDTYPNVKIIFRTFGSDGEEVLKNFKHKNVIKGFFNIDKLILDNGITLNGLEEINNFIKTTTDHIFIQEDYHHWNNNTKSKLFGKQLLGTPDFHQIFFDDNPCVNVLNNTNAIFIKINTLQAMRNNDYFIKKIREFKF